MKNQHIRRIVSAIALAAAVTGGLSLASPAQASPAQFKGTWVNMDNNTKGIVRMQITQGVHGLGLRVFGACSPTPCDWGLTGLVTYGNNVSDPDHKYGTASYVFSFKRTAMTFQLIDATTMVVHHYNQFTDGSGRQNYHSRELFRKLVIPIPIPGAIISR